MSKAKEQNNKRPKGKGAGPTRSFDSSVTGPGSPLDKLQFWTHKPAFYADTGGHVQRATSTEVNVRGQEMRRSGRIRQMPADERPPF